MSNHRLAPTPRELLEQDRRGERRVFWRGVLALAVVILVVVLRQLYWL